MRIAALQCDFEGGADKTLEVPTLWKEFGFDTEQLFHPMGELYSAVFDKKKHGDIVRKYIDKSTTSDISIILYLNCHILLESQNHLADTWAQIEGDGSYRKLYGTYLACCMNSSWMDYFLSLIEDLADYNIAGIFFDGPINRVCHCPRCTAKFAELYGSEMSEASEKELKQFSMWTYINAKKVMYEKVKSVNPEWIAYFNEGVMHSSSSSAEMRQMLAYNDIVGTEGGFQFGGRYPVRTELWRAGVHAKMTEAVAEGKPTVIFMAGDQKSWAWYLHTPAETKLCYASIIANGASVWYGIHCATPALDSISGNAAREMVQFDKGHSELYQQTDSLAKIAIFRSLDTANNYTATGELTDLYTSESREACSFGDYSLSFNGAVASVFRSNKAFDLVTELNIKDLEKYSVVLVPTAACLSSSIVDAFKHYVSNGGCLIVDSEFGVYDENGNIATTSTANQLLGIEITGAVDYNRFDYFSLTDAGDLFAEKGVEFIPAPLKALKVKVADDTEVMAELCHPLAGVYSGKPEKGAYPFMIKRKLGSGSIYYFAGTFFELYHHYATINYRNIVKTIIEQHCKFDYELIGASEAVEFTVRKSNPSGNVLVHLVNYSGGMSMPIKSVIPLHGLRLKVPEATVSARSLLNNCDLNIENNEISLPVLNEFDVIQIKI